MQTPGRRPCCLEWEKLPILTLLSGNFTEYQDKARIYKGQKQGFSGEETVLMWEKSPICISMEHLQRVWHTSRERLPFRTPGSVPHFGTC